MNRLAPAACATLIGAVGLTTAAVLSMGQNLARAQTPPENDTFARAARIQKTATSLRDSLPFDTTELTAGATLETAEPRPCGSGGATVWFKIDFIIPDFDITIDTAGSDFQTAVSVYTLTNFVPSPPSGASLGTVTCGASTAGDQARVTLHFPREPIYIQIGGLNGATGTLHLHIDCVPGCTNGSPTPLPSSAPLPTFVPEQVPDDAPLPTSASTIRAPATGTGTQRAGDLDLGAALVALLFLLIGSASLVGGASRVR